MKKNKHTSIPRIGVFLTVLIGAVPCVLLPTALAWYAAEGRASLLLLFVYWLSLFFVLIGALYLLQFVLRWMILRLIASILVSTYFLVTYLILVYTMYTGSVFDIRYMTDSLRDAIPTAMDVIGPWAFGGLMLGAIVLWTCDVAIWMRLQRSVLKWGVLLRTLILVTSVFTFLDAKEILPKKIQAIFNATEIVAKDPRRQVSTFFPDNTSYKTSSNENFFMLQLESGNALALQGQATVRGKQYSGLYIPYMKKIAEDGVFFPYFWGNTVQTNRAQEVILCGLANNMTLGYSQHLQDLHVTCLPQLMRRSGYKTIAFLSDDLGFSNEGGFMYKIGFSQVHYSDIMKPGDPKYTWGYDDCTFYKRAFEFLKEKYPNPEKLFVYFEVSVNHVPFALHKQYDFLRQFPKTKAFIEKYLDSSIEQDYCVGQFYEDYSKYAAGNTHLIVTPDHSWPVGIQGSSTYANGAKTENFLIPFTYIPPASERASYRTGEEVSTLYSEENILPTVFDLLNKQPYQNSFASVLRKDDPNPAPVDDCQLLVQPYSNRGKLVIVKNQYDYYEYSLLDKVITYFNIKNDLLMTNPRIIAEDVPYQEFRKKYYCKRYLETPSSKTTMAASVQKRR